MKLNLSIDLAIVISLITVFLFANGNAYIGGYLHTFNVDPIILNYSIQDKIYIGYIRGFNYLIYTILILFFCIAAWHIWISLDASKKIAEYLDKKFSTTPKKHKPAIHNSIFYEELANSYSRSSTLGILIILTLVSTLFLLAKTEEAAKKQAYADIENMSFDPVSFKSTVDKHTHFVVLCGSTLCAIIDKNKKVTLEETKNLEFTPKKPPKHED
ncbi:MAG TPA: hypothetical protein GXX13_09305 [Acinetobacter towneri]|nr:hypothetical protein [Acinetobacter towneri]